MKTLPILLLALLFALPSFAEVPKEEIEKMQAAAAEDLVLEITSVRRKRMNTKNGFYFSYRAKGIIKEVRKSATGLDKDAIIEFRYRVPDLAVNPRPGSYPAVVERGKTYQAYLRLGPDGRKLYVPAAASGSFGAPSKEEEKEAEKSE